MKVLITGSSGMLAKDIINAFAKLDNITIHGIDQTSSPNCINYTQHLLDLTDMDTLYQLIQYINPDLIIHTAAIVNLKICEENFNLANKLHIESSRVLASTKVKIVYISTDSVFNGINGNYTEESIPDPLNNYARSKYLGELAVRANNPNHIIVRTNIFGYSNPLKGSLCEWAIKSFQNGKNIYGFDDVIFNAMYTKHLAAALLDLFQLDFRGIINIASSNYISKYDFVKYLAIKFDVPLKMISRTSVSNIDLKIARPHDTTLNIDRANQILIIPSVFEGIDQLYIDYNRELTNE